MENRKLLSANVSSQKNVSDQVLERSKKEPSYKTKYIKQQKQFFQKQLSKIIKNQIKMMKESQKLIKELESYNKQNGQKILVLKNEKQRLKEFKSRQKSIFQEKYQKYQKQKAKKQQHIKKQKQLRKYKLVENKIKREQKQKTVRSRVQSKQENIINRSIIYIENEKNCKSSCSLQTLKKINNRHKIRSMKNFKAVRFHFKPKIVDEEEHQERQKIKIKKFILKMKKSEDISLKKDFKNEQRKQKSFMKCLLKDRLMKQNVKMEEDEIKYNQKMSQFSERRQSLKLSLSQDSFYKSVAKKKERKKVLRKQSNLHETRMQTVRNSVLLKYHKTQNTSQTKLRKECDEKNSKLMFRKNFSQLHHINCKEKHEENMHYLYRKVKKIQLHNSEQELAPVEKYFLAKFLDKEDENYGEFMKFLQGSKSSFVQRVLQKEEENKRKKPRK